MNWSWSFALTFVFILIFVFLIVRFIYRNPENREAIMKAFQRVQQHIQNRRVGETATQAPMAAADGSIPSPTAKDVSRYRFQSGTNVGSVFILERWLTPSMFPDSAQGSSELVAADAWIAQEGIELARQRFEKHWREYVTDPDLEWLKDAKCNTIRLPIGYFTLGPQFCEHTAFSKVAPVYKNAWDAVKQLIWRCHERDIAVLIDLHGLPGGANTGDHSGTNSAKAELWGSQRNLQLATKCICFIVQQAQCLEGVAGVQIVNEAEYDAKGMYAWYDKVLTEVSHVDPTVPIYVSDGWNLNRALTWMQTKNSLHGKSASCNPVVMDTHLYWAFTDEDKAKSPQQIIYEVPSKLSELDGKDGNVLERGAAEVVVGEWSCVLTEDSWAKANGVPKEQLVNQFGTAQCLRYQQRAGGRFFWTYRMDWMDGGEWGFKQMNNRQAVAPPVSLTPPAAEIGTRIGTAQSQKDYRRGTSWGAHCQYWDTQFPGQYEHYRFPHGWDVGFADAAAFFGSRSQRGFDGGDKIGMLDLWCLKRIKESGQSGQYAWEWETGFRQGVRDFYEVVGV